MCAQSILESLYQNRRFCLFGYFDYIQVYYVYTYIDHRNDCFVKFRSKARTYDVNM